MTIRRRYPALLFDLDGTLIDSATDLVLSVQHALTQLDDREPPDADTITMEIGKPLEQILHNLGYAGDEARTTRFVDSYRSYYAEHFNDHTRIYPGAEDTLGLLREHGVKLALVTTKHQAQADFTVAATGLARYFDYVHGWREGLKHKPDPEPLQIALQRLGAEPGEALMVGDSEQDILAAQAAGVDACAACYGFRPVLFLKSLRPAFMVAAITDVVHIALDGGAGQREADGSVFRQFDLAHQRPFTDTDHAGRPIDP